GVTDCTALDLARDAAVPLAQWCGEILAIARGTHPLSGCAISPTGHPAAVRGLFAELLKALEPSRKAIAAVADELARARRECRQAWSLSFAGIPGNSAHEIAAALADRVLWGAWNPAIRCERNRLHAEALAGRRGCASTDTLPELAEQYWRVVR